MPQAPLPPLPIRRVSRDVRRLIARRPWIYWLAIGALAAWAYAVADAHTSAADRARAEWGTRTPVLVATADVAPGDHLDTAVGVREWPAAIVPADALAALPDGAIARQYVARGELVGVADIAGPGPLALVPTGWLAVPVRESPRSGAGTGDRVHVASEGVVIAEQALVVGAVDGDVTLVAVPQRDAPQLPLAAAAGSLTLLRVP